MTPRTGRRLAGAIMVSALVVACSGATTRTSQKSTSTSTAAARADEPPTTAPCDRLATIGRWPLEQRLEQLLMVGVEPMNAHDVLSRYAVGGIFINVHTTGELTPDDGARFRSSSPIPPIVAIDEEGGRIQRIPGLIGPIPSAREMARTMTPAQVRDLAAQRGQALRRYGVTMDFAPVVDVSAQSDTEIIGDRSFSDDPAIVVAYAGAFADGLRSAGVIPVVKHFPGHGHAAGDSHREVATTPDLASLEKSDLVPYRQLLNSGPIGVMIGHLDVPGLTTADEPASINGAAIEQLLRRRLGYRGFVITDDLATMVAITRSHSLADATVRALQAGADMALSKTDEQVPSVLSALTQAVETGALSTTVIDRAVGRILALKGFDPCAR